MRIQFLVGRLINWLSLPGIVVESTYTASTYHAIIHVRTSPLFTVVTVNGLDVYFHRLTGKIDGVGFIPGADYTLGPTPESACSPERPGSQIPPTRK